MVIFSFSIIPIILVCFHRSTFRNCNFWHGRLWKRRSLNSVYKQIVIILSNVMQHYFVFFVSSPKKSVEMLVQPQWEIHLVIIWFFLSIYFHRYQLVLESQPQWFLLIDNPYAQYTAYVLMAVGTTLALTSFFALGFYGTYLGKSICKPLFTPLG